MQDDEIGEIDRKWNWLAIEYPEIQDPKLIHYTLGTPCFKEYKDTSMASYWQNAFKKLSEGLD